MQKLLLIFEGAITAVDVSNYLSHRFFTRKESSTFITADYKYEFIDVAELENSEETLLEWFDENSLYTPKAEHSFIELAYSEKNLIIESVKSIAENENLLGIQVGSLFIKTSQLLRLTMEHVAISFL